MRFMLQDLLDQLEAQWRRLQAPIADALRPGLTDRQLDDVSARLDLVLPGELRALWAWHDGADPSTLRDIGPGGYEFLTSDEVVAARQFNLQVHGEADADLPDMYWHRTWIPFMNQDA